MTSPGISINGRGENSCSINSIGKSGSRSCGVNGARVPGCSGGSMGSGNDGRTLTQTSGIWLSRRRNLECSDMGEITITEGEQTSLTRGANPCRSRLKRRLQARLPAPRLKHKSRLLRFGFGGVDAGDFQQFFETPQRAMFLAVIQQGAHLRDGESQNRPYFREWRRVDAHRGVLAEVPRQVLDHRFDFRWRAFGAALHRSEERIRPFLAGQARLAKVARIVALQADPARNR